MTMDTAMTVLSGLAIWVSAVFLAVMARALGPEYTRFPCVDRSLRFTMGFCAFMWFLRGSMILTSIGTPDQRHVHWDLVAGSLATTIMMAKFYQVIVSQTLPLGAWPALRRRLRTAMRMRDMFPHHPSVSVAAAKGLIQEAPLSSDHTPLEAMRVL